MLKITEKQCGLFVFLYISSLIWLICPLSIIFQNTYLFVCIYFFGLIPFIILCMILSEEDRQKNKDKERENKTNSQIDVLKKENIKLKEENVKLKKEGESLRRHIKEMNDTPIVAKLLFTNEIHRNSIVVSHSLLVDGHEATFKVKYANGRIGTETVNVESHRFELLSNLDFLN